MSDLRRCGLFVGQKLLPLQNVDVKCTIRQDFCAQVTVLQEFLIEGCGTTSVSMQPDTDGDVIEFRFENGIVKELVNGKVAVANVKYFELDALSGEYKDVGGFGKFPMTQMDKCVMNLHAFFDQIGRPEILKVKNNPVNANIVEGDSTGMMRNNDVVSSDKVNSCYYFPLETNAAVYNFVAHMEDGSRIQGKVQEKNKARTTFDNAVESGKTAFLLESDSRDIFQMSVGNVTIGEKVRIEISYCAELEMDGGKIRVRIPNRIAPKYGGGPVTEVSYPINFDFSIKTSTPIGDIEALGGVHLDVVKSPGDLRHVRATAFKEGYMNDDLVLLIPQEDPYGTYCTLEKSYTTKSQCLRLTFNEPVNTEMGDTEIELIFLVDKSGSMNWHNRLTTAKHALNLFLRSMPLNSHFNIVTFNNSSQFLSQEGSLPYTDENLERATEFVNNIKACGGTNIHGSLSRVLQSRTKSNTSILLLTDGDVRNTTECMNLAAKSGVRVFTIGVGKQFSQELVQGVASASNATWEAAYDTNDMGSKIIRLLGYSLSPTLKITAVDTGAFGECTKWPGELPTIFAGKRYTVNFIRDWGEGLDELPGTFNMEIAGEYSDGSRFSKIMKVITREGEGVTLEEVGRSRDQIDTIMHRLAAMSQIRQLDSDADDNSKQICELGLKYNLASEVTSFVAVRKSPEGERLSLQEMHYKTPVPDRMQSVTSQRRYRGGGRGGDAHGRGRSAPRSRAPPARRSAPSTRGHLRKKRSKQRSAPQMSPPRSARRSARQMSPPRRSARRSDQPQRPARQQRRQQSERSHARLMEMDDMHASMLGAVPNQSWGRKEERRGGSRGFKKKSRSSKPMFGSAPTHSSQKSKSQLRNDMISIQQQQQNIQAYSLESQPLQSGNELFQQPTRSAHIDQPALQQQNVSMDSYRNSQQLRKERKERKTTSLESQPLQSRNQLFQAQSFGIQQPTRSAHFDDGSSDEEDLEFIDAIAFGDASTPPSAKIQTPDRRSQIQTQQKQPPDIKFDWLLQQQRVRGNFRLDLSDSRFSYYAGALQVLRQKLQHVGDIDQILATLLAMYMLSNLFDSKKQEWKLMYSKAERLVTSSVGNTLSIDELLSCFGTTI